jgi:hypothetical protein
MNTTSFQRPRPRAREGDSRFATRVARREAVWRRRGASDVAITAAIVAGAALLAGVAFITRPAPPDIAAFSDVGEAFYPDFVDPLSAASLEVVEFDADAGAAVPFNVQVKDGRWTIPSHYDYPADGKDRLARTAASVMDLRKDIVQSDRAQDHEALGVIDPLDESTPSLTGRGTRITLRDGAGAILADYVIGRPVPGREGFRYLRLPEKKRVYAVKVEADYSTRFADWIETNLLDLAAGDIDLVDIRDYSIDEQTGRVDVRGNVVLAKGDDGAWSLSETPEGRELDTTAVNQMTSALSRLTITGVRPKPEALSADLRAEEGLAIDLGTQLSLQSKGYFIAQDGRLLSNEGEVSIGTADGVLYTLRFGEVLYGSGLDVSAGAAEEPTGEAGDTAGGAGDEEPTPSGPENRYLFVTATFDESLLPPKPSPPAAEGATAPGGASGDGIASGEPPADDPSGAEEPAGEPSNVEEPAAQEPPGELPPAAGESIDAAAAEAYERALQAWEDRASRGREKASALNTRFAPWYYVISAADFSKIRLDLDRLLKDVIPSPNGQE